MLPMRQRKVIYTQRQDLMEVEDIQEAVLDMRDEVFGDIVNQYIPPGSIDEQWDVHALENALESDYGIKAPIAQWLEEDESLHEEPLKDKIFATIDQHFKDKEAQTGSRVMRDFEKAVMLNVLDQLWKEHLAAMDYLRRGIGLRGYAQKQPKQEYKRESFAMFTELLDRIKVEVVKILARVKVREDDDVEAVNAQRRGSGDQSAMQYQHAQAQAATGGRPPQGSAAAQPGAAPVQTFKREGAKVGRNDPCPCGSGKKYKQCHGKLG